MKAEKYLITIQTDTASSILVRFGFGAAGEEVQKLLEVPGTEEIRVRIEGKNPEARFPAGRLWRLLDIKQRIKGLKADLD